MYMFCGNTYTQLNPYFETASFVYVINLSYNVIIQAELTINWYTSKTTGGAFNKKEVKSRSGGGVKDPIVGHNGHLQSEALLLSHSPPRGAVRSC